MSKVLTLPVKAVYFFEIQSGYKTEEYRLCTPYWSKRIENHDYFGVEITLGYPSRDCAERRIFFPWRGFRKTTIVHSHFGSEPVLVYAIRLAKGRRAVGWVECNETRHLG